LPLSTFATSFAFWAGVLGAGAIACLVALRMKKLPELIPSEVLSLALASALLIPYLLPRMHERYFYLADLFSVLYAFLRPSRWWMPVFIVCASLMSYMPFLSGQVSFLSWAHVDLRVPALLLLIPILVVAGDLRGMREGGK